MFTHLIGYTMGSTLVALLAALLFAPVAWSQDEPLMDGMGNINSQALNADSPAAKIYIERCAQCHDNAEGRTPPRASLRYRPPEGVYQALRGGAMAPMVEGLADEQIKSLVKLLTGREPKEIVNPATQLCANIPASVAIMEGDWTSTHGDIRGRRSRQHPEFTASAVARLQLKWSYAYPGGAAGPVTQAGDSLFLAGTGYVVALNAERGCAQWAYPTQGRIVRAVTVVAFDDSSGRDKNAASSVALFGDDTGTVFALNAASGAILWQTNVENHVLTRITSAPTVYDGIVYIPLSSMEDPLTHDKSYFCCSARGGVAAVDLRSGRLLWKQHHITESLASLVLESQHHSTQSAAAPPSKEHASGQFQQGPAGASTYTPLTIDAKRGVVYATTAEEYGFTGAAGPYSVIAYDLQTGKRAWEQSFLPEPDERSRICAERVTDCRNFFSMGTSVLIHPLPDGKDILVVGQKSGKVYGIDPNLGGKVLWSTQVSEGGDLGGVMYGLGADDKKIYVPISDVDSPEQRLTGSLVALNPANGEVVWRTKAPQAACNWDKSQNCIAGQVAAVTVVSDMVFAGFWDGYVRIYATGDGRLLREIDTAIEYDGVNGTASGGQVSGYPITVGRDALYITSGASSIMKSGNALLVYTVDGQ